MLKNLVKYDFKWVFKNIIIFIILGLVFACLGRLLGLIENSLIFKIISAICKGASTSLLISAVINTLIRTWVRTNINIYKDEGYLTNTLPVEKGLHFDSKFFTLCVTLIITIITAVLGLIIMYFNENTIDVIKGIFVTIEQNLNVSVTLVIILMVILVILEFLFIGLCGFVGIIYGNTYNDKKLAKTFVLGVGSYFVLNIVTLLVFLLLAIFDEGIKSMFFNSSGKIEYSSGIVMLITGSVLYIIYIAVLYYLSKKKLDSGINID